MPERPGAKADTRAVARRILMVRPPGCMGQQPVPGTERPDPRRWQRAAPPLPGPGAPLLPGAVPAQRRRGEPACDPSDTVGLARAYYATCWLFICACLHQDSHPHYMIVDSFLQAALRGSRARHRPARQQHADTSGPVRSASTASEPADRESSRPQPTFRSAARIRRSGPLRRWIKRLVGCLRMGLMTTNEHADQRIGMQRRNTRYSA